MECMAAGLPNLQDFSVSCAWNLRDGVANLGKCKELR